MLRRRKMPLWFIILAILIHAPVVLMAKEPEPVAAQARTTPTPSLTPNLTPTLPLPSWSAPDLLFTSRGAIHTPLLISDQEGRLHLFWKMVEPSNELGEPGDSVLYYSQKNQKGWSDPVNILVSPSIFNPTAAVDSYGILHLMWSGDQQLQYTRVHVDKATNVQSWSKPAAFDTINQSPHLVIDQHDQLHVVFPATRSRGVYYMYSTNGGDKWSVQVNISPADRRNTSADYTRIAVTPNGTIHVVWTEFQLPSGWPPTGIFYSRSEDGGKHWSRKVHFTGSNFDQANISAVNDKEIHVVWNAMVSVAGRFHRWSADGGQTWFMPNRISSLGGTEGPPQIAIDSAGTVHLVTTYGGCPNYHYFKNGGWTGGICLISKMDIEPDAEGMAYIEEPAFTIARGKQLHAIFWDNRHRLWYANADFNSAWALRPVRFTTRIPPIPTSTQTQALTPIIEETPTPLPALQEELSDSNPIRSLVFDLLPAMVVIILGAGVVIFLRRQPHNTL